MSNQIIYQIASGNPLLWLDTAEFVRASNTMTDLANRHLSNRESYKWNIVDGVVDANTGKVVEASTQMPHQPIEFLKKQDNPCILHVYDFNEYLGDHEIWRSLLNGIDRMKNKAQSFVVVAPFTELNDALSRYMTVVDFSFPTTEELIAKANKLAEELDASEDYSEEDIRNLAIHAKGLTEFEFENALSLSFAKSGKFTLEFIKEQRQQMIKKAGTLEIFHSPVGFEGVVGLDRLKTFAKTMVESKNSKGILLVGHPGVAKTHFAKCLGTETDRPTIVLETGRLMGSLVGQTEKLTRQAFQVINSQPQSIVFIDEIEKALSGTNSQTNDSSIRQGGQILQWLNEEKEDIFVVATANDISKLPPEFLRAGRWDAIFFVDLPTQEEAKALLTHFCEKFDVAINEELNLANWTGAEIETLCRTASNMKCPLEEAQEYVQPIYKVASEKIENLRNWAQTRTINASRQTDASSNGNENQTRQVVQVTSN